MLGKPSGVFSLNNSDNNVGSYFTVDDCVEIFDTTASDLRFLVKTQIDGIDVIDENEVFKAWYANRFHSNSPTNLSGAQVSADECILAKIILRTFPDAIIERQYKVGRYKMDLKVTVDKKTVFIEFDGPGHFAPSRWGIPSNHPFKKKNAVEQITGIEVINWAYWIQRCTLNVRALFDTDIRGYGALWSTKVLFGSFVFEDSADIVITINKRFNAARETGVGYFYEAGIPPKQKSEHPIIQQIIDGKAQKELLLPQGYRDENYWLPDKLKLL